MTEFSDRVVGPDPRPTGREQKQVYRRNQWLLCKLMRESGCEIH